MELRKDYILDRWVVIASNRAKRPEQFKSDNDIYAGDKGSKSCFFCPGNEEKTPNELGRVNIEGDGWSIRWFKNKFAAVDKNGSPHIKTADTFFTYSTAYGEHEVIVETNDHHKQLPDFSENEILNVLKVYSQRIEELLNEPHVSYVNIFKNHGGQAGTSIVHSHSQLISTNIIPPEVNNKLEQGKKFDSCPYCDIINVEKQSLRRVHENNNCVAFTPYASRFNFETWIFPKHHLRRLNDFSDEALLDLARCIKFTLKGIKDLNASFNMVLYYSPKGEDLHFHIEILPRIAKWAGFELETGITINVISPEDAAKYLRGEKSE